MDSLLNSILFWITLAHVSSNYLNEKECQSVVIKTYPQCQSDRGIQSSPDGLLGIASELISDAPANCLEAPMELGLQREGPCADLLQSPIEDNWGK
ncbi:hypothetical protein TNCV_311231 [Trichonephila clavipes]|nr:hypothetical protein TNCV_311231 [Trichonephila clavipes]